MSPKAEISLFDLPQLLRLCLDMLRKQRISRVHPEQITVLHDKVSVQIAYFRALDAIDAEPFHRGVDLNRGSYCQYRLPVCEQCEIVWTKQTGGDYELNQA